MPKLNEQLLKIVEDYRAAGGGSKSLNGRSLMNVIN